MGGIGMTRANLRCARSRRWAAMTSVFAACLTLSVFFVPAASATVDTARLKITPSEIYYPCSEGSVTFKVTGFPASSRVTLEIGSSTATPAASIETNTGGSGSTSLSFSNYYPGDYVFFATGSSLQAHKTLTIGECP